MITKIWESFLHFWASDRGLSIFLTMIVILVFILPLSASMGITGRLLFDIFFSLLLVSGIAAISGRRKVFVTVAGISIVALAVRWLDASNPSPLLELLDFLTTITATIFFAIVVLSQVLKKGPITPHRIQGAIAVYLLLGFAWAHVYALIEYLSPGAFTGAVSASGRFTSWMYFSFVTLATLGYGDIAPLHPIARSLATAEAITGQLYLAILIARLVSQELHHRTSTIEDDSKDKTPPKS